MVRRPTAELPLCLRGATPADFDELSPEAVLVVDETGFLKMGTHSADVARQCSGTAGKVDTCQVGVFVAYASRLGQTLLDRALYLPQSWTEDAARCRLAGIDAALGFATKPELARRMLERVFAWGVPASWVVDVPRLCSGVSTVMRVACAGGWKVSERRMCWRYRARHTCGRAWLRAW